MFARTLKVTACLAVVLAIGAAATAGRVPVPATDTDIVEAYSSMTYYIDFYGGEWAQVEIDGDNDTDLDLKIYDSSGRLVAQDLGYSDHAICEWYPRRRGTYRVVVENLGNVWNRYSLWTN
jgi:hypothetical protein